MRSYTSISSALVSLLLAACPGPDPKPDAVADAAGEDGASARPYLLGTRAQVYRTEGLERWVISTDRLEPPAPDVLSAGDAQADVQTDVGPEPPDPVEAVVVPGHLLGIPWDEFEQEQVSNLPGPWVAALQEVRQTMLALGKPLVLALSPTSEDWDNLAPRAADDGTGQLWLEHNWLKDYCHDPSKDADPLHWSRAYARYAVWMVELFEPQFVYLARRINRFEEQCGEASPTAYPAVAAFATAAHDKIKAEVAEPPTTVVTVDVEDLYGFLAGPDGPKKPGRCVEASAKECFAERSSLLDAFTADRLGLESYPAVILPVLHDLPPDWLSTVAAYRSDMPPIIAGTGLPAVSLQTRSAPTTPCIPLLESTEELQRLWLDQVISTADAFQMELVVWASLLDQLDPAVVTPCDCTADFMLCQHLEQLGAKRDEVRLQLVEGLWDFEGVPRQAASLWLDVAGGI